ncbi:MAG TPA: nicotinate phosphoribosyltransferase [archaeon]|nr:nicotinate phosphoribosyltransferase [archaeon]
MDDSEALLTDDYQITMVAGYLHSGKADESATFDMFVRGLPKNWGYYVAVGVEDVIDYVTGLKFSEGDLEFLESKELGEDLVDFFRKFKFDGDVFAVREGTPVAPDTPVLRFTGKRAQVQYFETAVLNKINSQIMVATKASRIVNAAGEAKVLEFGMRRAHGKDAAMKGSRAAYIAGCVGTSNKLAEKIFGIQAAGTMAHSFVMSFPTELDAFRAYAETFPDRSVLLIDTYNTLLGARNAITVAKELEAKGKKLVGVRIDSGDLAEDSKAVRKMMDEANLEYVKIVASDDLDEMKIEELTSRGARIDLYGVGTSLITARPVAAISGVYKLVEDCDGPKVKLSSKKKSYPGKKQVYRFIGPDGKYSHDVLALNGELSEGTPLLEPVVIGGKRVFPRKLLEETRTYCLESVAKLPDHVKRVEVKEPYRVEISAGLKLLTERTLAKYSVMR